MGEWSKTVIEGRTVVAQKRTARRREKFELELEEVRSNTQRRIKARLPQDTSDSNELAQRLTLALESLVDGGAAVKFDARRAEITDAVNDLTSVETEARREIERLQEDVDRELSARERSNAIVEAYKQRGFDTRAPTRSGVRLGPWLALPVVVFIESIFAFPVLKGVVRDQSAEGFFQDYAGPIALLAVVAFALAGSVCIIIGAGRYKQYRAQKVMNEIAEEYGASTHDNGSEALNLKVDENRGYVAWFFAAAIFQVVLFGFRLIENSSGFADDSASQLFSLLASLLPLALGLYEYQVASVSLVTESFDQEVLNEYLILRTEAEKEIPLERLRLEREEILLRQNVLEKIDDASTGIFSDDDLEPAEVDRLTGAFLEAIAAKKREFAGEIKALVAEERAVAAKPVGFRAVAGT